MNTAQYVEVRPSERAVSTAPTWWVVFKRELADLWIGGKAPALLLIYSILLGILTYVLASNSDLSLVPPKEMVFETLRSALEMGLFIGLILGFFSPSPWGALATGLVAGVFFGLITSAIPYAMARGTRDFSSTMQLVAGRYDVLCDPQNAERGRDLLARLTI